MEYTLYGELYLTNITKLKLQRKKLTYIDPNIKYFVNLQILDLIFNKK